MKERQPNRLRSIKKEGKYVETPLNAIFVDLDQTLSNTKLNEQTGHYDLGEAFDDVAEAVSDQFFKGREIVIFTARPEEEWDEVRDWLDHQAVPYHRVSNVKEPALFYVDDHAMRPDEFVTFNTNDTKKRHKLH